MERADQWGLFIRLVGWWDTTRGRAISLLLDALNLAHIRAKVYQCFMFLEKDSSTTYHNSSSRLAITRFRELL